LVRYFLRRIAFMMPVLLGVTIVVFLIMNLAPGDPAMIMLGHDATPEAVAQLRAELGLDQALPLRYAYWLGNVLHGDFGRSIWLGQPVLDEVLNRFQATALLAVVALFMSTIMGIFLGVISSVREHSILDRLSMLLALFGVSMPVFWLGIMLILCFSLSLRWLPPAGMVSPSGGDLPDLARHLVLPSITLAAPATAIVARLTRASMLEVIRQDYIRTAAAKGLGESAVILRHGLKNALIPVVTVIGVQVGNLLGGAVITETVFAWPGLGSLIVKGVLTRDFLLVQGGVLFIALVFSSVNLFVDMMLGYLDPRIRYS